MVGVFFLQNKNGESWFLTCSLVLYSFLISKFICTLYLDVIFPPKTKTPMYRYFMGYNTIYKE